MSNFNFQMLLASSVILACFFPVSAMDREMEIKNPTSITIQIHPNSTLAKDLFTYFERTLSPEDLIKSLLDQPINLPGTTKENFFPIRFAERIIARQTPLQGIQLWRQIIRIEEGLNQEKNQILWMMSALQGNKPPIFISLEGDKGKTLKAGEDRLNAIDHERRQLHKIIAELRTMWEQQPMDIQHLLHESLTVEQIMAGPFVHLKLMTSTRSITQRVIELLADNTFLLSLDINPHKLHLLSPKDISMLGYALIRNHTLQILGFDAHEITIHDTPQTARFSDYFKDPNVDTAQPLLDALSSSQSLKSLKIYQGIMSDAVMAKVSNIMAINSSLVRLDISQSHISLEAQVNLTRALQSNTTLRYLNLESASRRYGHPYQLVNDELTESLRDLIKKHPLYELNLTGRKLTNKQVKILFDGLTPTSDLRILHLFNCSITDEGVNRIADVLTLNPSLTSLYMGFNEITHNSVASFSRIFEANTVLKTFDLSWPPGYSSSNHINHSGQQGGSMLLHSLEKNSTITDLHLGYVGGEKCIAPLTQALGKLPHLTRIGIVACTFQQGEAESLSFSLKDHPSLTALELREMKYEGEKESLGEKVIKPLSESLQLNTTLTSLDLGRSMIGGWGAFYISTMLLHNTTITHLNLEGYYSDKNGITELGLNDLVQALSVNTSLTHLNLSYSSFSLNSLPLLASLLSCNSSLRELVLKKNDFFGSEKYLNHFLEKLKENKTLIHIDLSEIQISEFYKNHIRNEFYGRVTI